MSGGQWCLSKSFDDSAPIGPAIVKDVRFADANGLNIKGYLNDKLVQDSNTNDLIFPVAEIIEFLSAGMTLLPGKFYIRRSVARSDETRHHRIYRYARRGRVW